REGRREAGALRRRPGEISHLLAELRHLLGNLGGLGELLGCEDVADRERDRQALLGHLIAELVDRSQVGRRRRGRTVELVAQLLPRRVDLLAERLELRAMSRVDPLNLGLLLVAEPNSPENGPAEPPTPATVPAWSSPPVGECDCAAEQQYGGHCDHDSGASGHRDPPLVPSRPTDERAAREVYRVPRQGRLKQKWGAPIWGPPVTSARAYAPRRTR